MFSAIILSLLATTSSINPHCDGHAIMTTLRQIEIADYEPTAAAPPRSVVGDLYANAARNVVQCAGASHHFMGSRIRDLLQAAAFAKFAALAYFDARKPSQGCTMLHEAKQYNASAAAPSEFANSMEKRYLQANRQNVASIHQLLISRATDSILPPRSDS